MRLILIRHGKAQTGMGLPNEAYPLSEEGFKQMRDAASGLKVMGVTLTRVLTSPLVRALQTAQTVAEGLAFPGEIEKVPCLGGSCSAKDAVAELEDAGLTGEVAIVGHAPMMGHMAAYLLSGQEAEFFPFKKGQISALECGGLGPSQAVLLWSIRSGDLALMKP